MAAHSLSSVVAKSRTNISGPRVQDTIFRLFPAQCALLRVNPSILEEWQGHVKDALERLLVTALTPNKTGCPHQFLAQLPTIHQPKTAEAGVPPAAQHSLHLLWLKYQPCLPLELPGLAADSWPGIEGSKGFVGKWAGRSREGPREEKEDGQSKLLIKAQLRNSPCQEHSLTAKLPKEPVEELPSELEASLLSCS